MFYFSMSNLFEDVFVCIIQKSSHEKSDVRMVSKCNASPSRFFNIPKMVHLDTLPSI